MKNNTKIPDPSETLLQEAMQSGWEICPFFDKVINLDSVKVYTREGHEYDLADCRRFVFRKGADIITWPEYYRLHQKKKKGGQDA